MHTHLRETSRRLGLSPCDDYDTWSQCCVCGEVYATLICVTPEGETILLADHHCDPRRRRGTEAGSRPIETGRTLSDRLTDAERLLDQERDNLPAE